MRVTNRGRVNCLIARHVKNGKRVQSEHSGFEIATTATFSIGSSETDKNTRDVFYDPAARYSILHEAINPSRTPSIPPQRSWLLPAVSHQLTMPSATMVPKKRVLAETSRQSVPATPASSKKRKTGIFSSPAPFRSSQHTKLGSSQPKSAFEADLEVLDKLGQGMTDLKHSNSEKDQTWGRPPVSKDFDHTKDSLCFQQIEAEEGTLHGGSPTVKLFGVTADGNSVMLHVKDFKHYLYVAAPAGFSPQDVGPFRAYLESQIAQHQPVIHSVQMMMRENIYGFQNNTQNPYLKITVTDPKFINKVRSNIQSCNANWKGLWKSDGQILTFDNIQYVLRFMVDCQVSKHERPTLVRKVTNRLLDLWNVLGRGTGQ